MPRGRGLVRCSIGLDEGTLPIDHDYAVSILLYEDRFTAASKSLVLLRRAGLGAPVLSYLLSANPSYTYNTGDTEIPSIERVNHGRAFQGIPGHSSSACWSMALEYSLPWGLEPLIQLSQSGSESRRSVL